MSEAIYIVEFKSISRGVSMLDAMLKAASVTLLHADAICIGKYLVVVGGDVAEVKEAQKAILKEEKGFLAERLITGTHPAIMQYFARVKESPVQAPTSIGLVECTNISTGFFTLDCALKSGVVDLLKVWMGTFVGGKMCYVLGGEVSDVTAATKMVEQMMEESSGLVGIEVIASPDSVVMERFYRQPS